MKALKKIISVLMIVVMCLTMASLQGFVEFDLGEIFAIKSTAAGIFEEAKAGVFTGYTKITEVVINGSLNDVRDRVNTIVVGGQEYDIRKDLITLDYAESLIGKEVVINISDGEVDDIETFDATDFKAELVIEAFDVYYKDGIRKKKTIEFEYHIYNSCSFYNEIYRRAIYDYCIANNKHLLKNLWVTMYLPNEDVLYFKDGLETANLVKFPLEGIEIAPGTGYTSTCKINVQKQHTFDNNNFFPLEIESYIDGDIDGFSIGFVYCVFHAKLNNEVTKEETKEETKSETKLSIDEIFALLRETYLDKYIKETGNHITKRLQIINGLDVLEQITSIENISNSLDVASFLIDVSGYIMDIGSVTSGEACNRLAGLLQTETNKELENINQLLSKNESIQNCEFKNFLQWCSKEGFDVSEHLKCTNKCPTDVIVTDSNDELIVEIINNELVVYDPYVYAYVLNNEKTIFLPTDIDYNIEIIATDDGTMDYSVSTCTPMGLERTVEYNDVPLLKDESYTAVVPCESTLPTETYNLVSDSGKVIEADYDSLPSVEDNVVDVIVAEELFDGFPVEVIDLVADTMFNMKSVVDLSAYDISTDDAVALFSAIAKYYPAEYSLIANGDFTYKIIVSPELDRIMKIRFYYGDDANLSTYQKRVKDLNAEIDALVAQVQGMNDFEKALYIHDYIVLNCEYDLELLDILETNGTLTGELRSERYTEYSVLVNGTGICGSYALAYRAILNAAGMECLYLSSSQMNHAWNLVKIDGNWYHVDCCWDDPVPDTYGRARRTYFLRTDEEIMKLNHYSWSPGQYKATSKKYSEMPHSYDCTQKYENGYWYYTDSGDIVKSDVYGTNTEVIAENIYTNTIAVNNGDVYYANGRYIYKYDDDTDTSVLAAYLISSECGDKPESASIRNMHIDKNAENVIIYKNIYEDEEYKTIKTTIPIETEKYESITGIKLSDTELSLDVFASKTITAEFEPISEFTDFDVIFSSSDESIASVSSTGEITGKNVGTAIITASFDTFSATCEVTVTGDGLSGSINNNLKWKYEPETIKLTFFGEGIIPSASDWTQSIGLKNLRENIKIVEICDGITGMEKYSFSDCENLESIVIPDSVTSIGTMAFGDCENLESIVIPDSVISIGQYAFYSCLSLKSVVVSDSISCIDDYTFSHCENLESIVIPDSVTNIGASAFSYCENLKNIVIPDNVINIGNGAFENCFSLSGIDVATGNTAFVVEENVLFDYNKTEIVFYPYEKAEKEYSIPEGVLYVTGFFANEYLEVVNIPASLEDLSKGNSKNADYRIFRGFDMLKTINVDEANEYFCDVDGVLFDKNKTELFAYPANRGDVIYSIPDTVKTAFLNIFTNVKNLKTLIIPENVEKIWNSGSVLFGSSNWTENYSLEYIFVKGDVSVPLAGVDYFIGLKKIYTLNPDNFAYVRRDESKFIIYSPRSGHDYDECIYNEPHKHSYFLMDYVEYTDTTDGYEYWECYCGEDSYTKVVHHFGEEVVTAPSCTVEGTTSVTCTICGEVEIRATTEATGKHNFELTSTTPGDCETAPVYHYTCSVCGETQDKTGRIDDGHDYAETVTPPSCTKKGSTIATCSKCGETVIYDFVSPKGHTLRIKNTASYCSAHDSLEYSCITCDYTEVIAANTDELETEKVTVEPTCTEAGKEIEKCTLCGATVSEKILRALSHDYSDEFSIDKEASCVEKGEKSKHCSRCDARREITVVPALGHTESKWVITEPTCTKDGVKTKTCTVCNAVVESETIKATGHTEGEWVTESEPTCINDGKRIKKCTVCDEVVSVKTINATGHKDSDADNFCDECSEDLTEKAYCPCVCHKSGIIGFIWKIIRIIMMVFRVSPVCDCGIAHY